MWCLCLLVVWWYDIINYGTVDNKYTIIWRKGTKKRNLMYISTHRNFVFKKNNNIYFLNFISYSFSFSWWSGRGSGISVSVETSSSFKTIEFIVNWSPRHTISLQPNAFQKMWNLFIILNIKYGSVSYGTWWLKFE